jgi:hypothetical protein
MNRWVSSIVELRRQDDLSGSATAGKSPRIPDTLNGQK